VYLDVESKQQQEVQGCSGRKHFTWKSQLSCCHCVE